MAWERRRSGRYYYRTRKVQGRVIKEYVGTGALAEAAAERDAIARAHRVEESERRRWERAVLRELDAPVEAFEDTLEILTRAHLVSTGYHRHHGGEWRRRRHA